MRGEQDISHQGHAATSTMEVKVRMKVIWEVVTAYVGRTTDLY